MKPLRNSAESHEIAIVRTIGPPQHNDDNNGQLRRAIVLHNEGSRLVIEN